MGQVRYSYYTRKIIVLDLKEFTAVDMLALAAVTMALGVTYWLIARLQ
jgi:uncharacterized membrane protein (DUF373 family)